MLGERYSKLMKIGCEIVLKRVSKRGTEGLGNK
jgi:hypothetical protein